MDLTRGLLGDLCGKRIALWGAAFKPGTDAAEAADAVLVVTPWPEFSAIDPPATSAAAGNRLLIDACQAIKPGLWRAAGWTVAAPFPTPDYPERSPVTPGTVPGSRRG